MSQLYTVIFTGDFFTLTTCATADDEQQAIRNSQELLNEYHGINTQEIGVTNTEVHIDGEWLV